MGSSSRSYGDASSIGRKSVYSMNDASSNNSGNGDSGNSSPRSFTEYSESNRNNLTEIENLDNMIAQLELRVWALESNIRHLNDPTVRAVFNKVDHNLPVRVREFEIFWSTVRSIEQHHRAQFNNYRNLYGYNAALDNEVNKSLNSIRQCNPRLDMHNRRLQVLLAEEQNTGTSQSQNNSANNSDSDNNNN